MDNELLKIAEETKELTEENNKILRSMQRRAHLGMFFRTMYWLVIIGIGVGAFYYIQPYIDDIMKSYSSLKETQAKISNFPKSIDEWKVYFSK